MSSSTLTASYTSPDNEPFNVTLTLPAPSSNPPTVDERTAYLKALRVHVTDAQARINKELTERMEQDKARDAGSSKGGAVNDAKDEENYGEEVQEED